jgi:hypothetical protein
VNRRTLIIAIVAFAIVGVVLTVAITRDASDNRAGLGLPTENLVERPSDGSTALAGALHVAGNGCFHLDADDGTRYFVVWPQGFESDAAEVVAPGGARYGDGDPVAGDGWIRDADEVVAAADGPDGYMGAVLGYCAEDEQIAVLHTTS